MDDLGFERGGFDFANYGPVAAEALAVLGFDAEVPRWINKRYRRFTAYRDPPEPRFVLDPRR